MFLKQLPHLTFLNVNSEFISEIEDDKNINTNEEYQFDSIKRLQIDSDIPWETVLSLLKYFPKLINVDVFCALLDTHLNDILGPFTLNDAAGTEYLRRVNRIKEREEKDSLELLEMTNESHELLKSLGYK